MRKCGFGPGSGRRGSRRASWGKDLLGRWAIFKCFTISKIWNLYLSVDIFECCGCLADVGCAAFQAHPIRRCVYKATHPTFLAPSFHDYLGRTSHCHEPVEIEFFVEIQTEEFRRLLVFHGLLEKITQTRHSFANDNL